MFPGGCFITATSCEFDGREGPVRDTVDNALRRWMRTLQQEAQTAIDAGELPLDADPALIAFQLNSIAMGANLGLQLLADIDVIAIARNAMRQTLSLSPGPVNPQAHRARRRRTRA